MLTNEQERYLTALYFSPSRGGSFTGLNKLYLTIRKTRKDISKKDIKTWLQNQPSYSLYKHITRKVKRPVVIAPFKFYMLDGDTANFEQFSEDNDNYKYIAIFIDILSHYLYAYPLKSLKAVEMKETLSKLLKHVHPYIIRTDRGGEFKGVVKQFLKTHNIKHITTSEHSKANYAERVIRTIKLKLARFMRHANSNRWINILPEIVEGYNNTFHRTIKMSPFEALSTDNQILWQVQYESQLPLKKALKGFTGRKFTFEVGDVVRISKSPKTFEKESVPKWTDELFTVSSRYMSQGFARYNLKDFANDPIADSFLPSELQKVEVDNSTTYAIDKILRKRTRRGVKEVLVHWKGWPSKFDTWIKESEVTDFKAQ